jgi:hypothetical protein
LKKKETKKKKPQKECIMLLHQWINEFSKQLCVTLTASTKLTNPDRIVVDCIALLSNKN